MENQKGDKRTQGDKRGGALGSISSFPGFSSRAVLGWWFDRITHVWYKGAVDGRGVAKFLEGG